MRIEIVEVGTIPNHLHHLGDTRWTAFHITTCHGLRLECSSLFKLQVCDEGTSNHQVHATFYATFNATNNHSSAVQILKLENNHMCRALYADRLLVVSHKWRI